MHLSLFGKMKTVVTSQTKNRKGGKRAGWCVLGLGCTHTPHTGTHTHTHPKLELNRPGLNLGVYVVFPRVGEGEPADDRVPSLRAKSDQCRCLLSVTGFHKEQSNNTISFLYLRPDADGGESLG